MALFEESKQTIRVIALDIVFLFTYNFRVITLNIKRIENEKKALIKLGDISFDRIITPNLLSVLRKNEFYGLVQDNILSNEGVSVNLSKVDLKAICEIHEKFNFKEVSLSEYFNEVGLYDQIKCLPEVKDYLSSANNRKILLALSHGDYIPWNRFLSKDKIKLIAITNKIICLIRLLLSSSLVSFATVFAKPKLATM